VPIVVEFHVSSIFSYTPTLRMKIHRFDWGLKLPSKAKRSAAQASRTTILWSNP